MPTAYYRTYDNLTNNLTYESSLSYNTASSLRSDIRSKSSRPNYKQLIAANTNATNPYTRSVLTPLDEFKAGESHYTYPTFHSETTATYFGNLPSSDPSAYVNYTRLDDIAYVKAINSMRDKITAFSTPTFLGELKETIEMLRHPVKGLRSGLDDFFNRAKKLKRNDVANHLSETWLEYSFGWKPFINDIESLMKTINALHSDPLYFRARATEREDFHLITLHAGHGWGHSNSIVQHEVEGYASSRYLGLFERKKTSSLSMNLDLFGINWGELAPAAWELFPWSFLIDYFVNVGDAVQANLILSQVNKVYLVKTRKSSFTGRATTLRDRSLSTDPLLTKYVSGGDGFRRDYFERKDAEIVIAVPSVTFHPLSLSKEINLLALLKLKT